MKVDVRFRGVQVTGGLRDYALRRVRFALGRFAEAIQSVVVKLVDINGPRGGADKRCQVHVHGPRLGALCVESSSADAYAAVDTAVQAASRAVVRELERGRTVHRVTRSYPMRRRGQDASTAAAPRSAARPVAAPRRPYPGSAPPFLESA